MDEKTVNSYAKLIYHIASKYKNYRSREDLYQAGFLGLSKAFESFDPKFNTKFSTYAYFIIEGEIKSLIRSDKSIKINREINSLKQKIEISKNILSQNLMREPTILEIADYLEVDYLKIAECIKSGYKIESLDNSLYDDSNVLLSETIPDKNIEIDSILDLKEELKKLSEMERKLIIERYIYDKTQQEMANVFNLSQVKISRMEKKVLTKMRNNLNISSIAN